MNPDVENSETFEILKASSQQMISMGGKAATLAKLLQLSFPVPPGMSIVNAELTESDKAKINQWVKVHDILPAAVRSSASGEDGLEVSYAGQFKTFLNIKTLKDLYQAVTDCFESVHRLSSQTYANHFQRPEIPMRVLIQKMIQPHFSGVFFSHDPRNQTSGWMIEAVEGLGEKLVSGEVTPYRYTEDSTQSEHASEGLTPDQRALVAQWGKKAQTALGYEIDMEWAIDFDGKFWVLQVRPITTGQSISSANEILETELKHLRQSYDADTTWDGHSFSELRGVPTPMTHSIWSEAFTAKGAFDLALRELGYEGLSSGSTESLLDSVFGRSYLNLKKMETVYFGVSPYTIDATPRPHLKFDWHKINIETLIHAPSGILKMAQVAWKVQTDRKKIAAEALATFNTHSLRHLSATQIYEQSQMRDRSLQYDHFLNSVKEFTQFQLRSTFLVTLLIESTSQSILTLLKKEFGDSEAAIHFQVLLSDHLTTVGVEMQKAHARVDATTESWKSFLELYGHRGIDELNLSQPRWIEIAAPIKSQQTHPTSGNSQIATSATEKVANILQKLSGLHRPVVAQELQELRELIQIREEIKMQSMKTYADIRWSLLSVGRELGLGEDIFFLTFAELQKIHTGKDKFEIQNWKNLILRRQEKLKVFRSVELPMSFSAEDLKDLFKESSSELAQNNSRQIQGVSLSPGMTSGQVHIVTDPQSEDLDSWPENTVLVAEATDPGWTPLFERSKAIIVARGGILSHCSILAREMGLPAVGEILHATTLFQEGENVRVDGIHGTVTRTH
jgi:rifampicin phosphotransferase